MDALRLILVARSDRPHVRQACEKLEAFLRTQPGIEILTVTYELDDCPNFSTLRPDLTLVIGGDGAILRVCRQMGREQFPILGVNLGRLGFLADLSPAEFCTEFPKIHRREYQVVDHLMFECLIERQGEPPRTFLGLNEVVVSSASLHMIDIHLAIDGEPVTTYSGDGLIISTPVGSTAHSLSAGGPILRQDLQAFVVTPICPHTLTVRPLVDRAECTYTLSVTELPDGVKLVVDGQVHQPLQSGDVVTVRRAPVSFRLAKIAGHGFYGTLHRKLGWGGQPRYRTELPGDTDEPVS